MEAVPVAQPIPDPSDIAYSVRQEETPFGLFAVMEVGGLMQASRNRFVGEHAVMLGEALIKVGNACKAGLILVGSAPAESGPGGLVLPGS